MKKVAVSYRAESLKKKSPASWAIIGAVVVVLFSLSIILLLAGFRENISLRIFSILSATCINVSLCYLIWINKGQTIVIDAAKHILDYTCGRKRYRIKPADINAVNSGDGCVEILAGKDRKIVIRSEAFPHVNLQGLAGYFDSVMRNDGDIRNAFFEDRDSGFHVTRKIMLESPNPWPHVLFIAACTFGVGVAIFFVVSRVIF